MSCLNITCFISQLGVIGVLEVQDKAVKPCDPSRDLRVTNVVYRNRTNQTWLVQCVMYYSVGSSVLPIAAPLLHWDLLQNAAELNATEGTAVIGALDICVNSLDLHADLVRFWTPPPTIILSWKRSCMLHVLSCYQNLPFLFKHFRLDVLLGAWMPYSGWHLVTC